MKASAGMLNLCMSIVRSLRQNIPVVEKCNGKTRRGDLVIKDGHLIGHRDLVVDTVLTHEFGGSHLADVSLNDQLRDQDPNWLLKNASRITEVERYQRARQQAWHCLRLPAMCSVYLS